jgi:ketosteroid isomerase-like protein
MEVEVVASGDIPGYLSLLANDAAFLPPNSTPKSGEELRTWLRQFLEECSVDWLEFTHGKTVISGDLAVHDYSYTWRVTNKGDGHTILSHGKGIQVYRRVCTSEWKLLRNIWNADPE